MVSDMIHGVEKKVLGAALKNVLKKPREKRGEAYLKVIDVIEKANGDAWSKEGYDKLRETFGSNGKWATFFDDLIDRVDVEYMTKLMLSIGFEGGFVGHGTTQKMAQKHGVSIPWVILFDPTTACNLKCVGCWASEYGKQLNLSYEDMDSIVTQGKELGIHMYVMTGGEPLVRKADIVKLAKKHSNCGFMLYTNGTLVDQQFCDDMRKCGNIVLSMSIEGFEETTDSRRGKGTFAKVMAAMDLMRKNGLVYGTSICYTKENIEVVTSDEFLDFLISKGVTFSWYFHYMPVGMDSTADLMPTPEQREYMYHRIREIRAFEGGKPIFTIDFQNDGDMVDGCIAGGKNYCHINPNGDMEPCVFIHYSGANIHEKSLLECLKQPLFRAYQANQPFNENMLQPCPMLENPEVLRRLVSETGAHSTDLSAPESCDHLCAKCDKYAEEWQDTADKLWSKSHPDYKKQRA